MTSAVNTTATDIIPLAAGFPEPDRAAWLALVDKTLKGAPLESLQRRTLEGLAIEPLYQAATDAPPIVRTAPGWGVRTLIREPDPALANADALAELAQGAGSLLLRLDPHWPERRGGGRRRGCDARTGRRVLDVAPVALDAGFLGPKAADWLGAAAKGAPAAQLSFHLDPLSALASAGVSPGPIEAHLIAAATVAARLAETYPKANLFLASGQAAHEAGGGEALELGFAAASALAYAKAMVRAGLPMTDAWGRIVLGLAVDADPFIGVAKLRAGRRIWARLAGACDAVRGIEPGAGAGDRVGFLRQHLRGREHEFAGLSDARQRRANGASRHRRRLRGEVLTGPDAIDLFDLRRRAVGHFRQRTGCRFGGSAAAGGYTSSPDFPVRNAPQASYGGGGGDGFVVRLTPAGDDYLLATYLGGSDSDTINGLTLESNGLLTVAGSTASADFPQKSGLRAFTGQSPNQDAFVAKFQLATNSLVFSTPIGGSGDDEAFGVQVDSTGATYVAGVTASSDFPVTPGVYQSSYGGGGGDMFLVVLSADPGLYGWRRR